LVAAQSTVEQSVRRLIAHIETAGREAVRTEKVSDTRLIQQLNADIAAYASPLIDLLKSINGDEASEFGLDCLWRLLGAAFFIGGASSPALVAALPTRRLLGNQAAVARERRREKVEVRHKDLDAAILRALGKTRLVADRKAAIAIHADVIRILGPGPGRSPSTIERRLQVLAKRSVHKPQT
jgi:hypothetical protein